jgi:hypothetical protein
MKKNTADMLFSGNDILAPLVIPDRYNYIGVFLTLECSLNCSYCINRFGDISPPAQMLTSEEWVNGLNRIVTHAGLPLSLQGGEPTIHPEFFAIVNGIRPDLPIDLLTNLDINIGRFIREIPPDRVKRDSPYASIRVSYHPETMKIEPLAKKVLRLLAAGYSVGIWGVLHPVWDEEIKRARDYCTDVGIDFRTKEFLGKHGGTFHGTIRYPGACDRGEPQQVICRIDELIIGPTGHIYRCHSDLYEGRPALGHLLDSEFRIDDQFRTCSCFGYCNPCDVKIKTDRHQTYGHTSVIIRSV